MKAKLIIAALVIITVGPVIYWLLQPPKPYIYNCLESRSQPTTIIINGKVQAMVKSVCVKHERVKNPEYDEWLREQGE